MLKKRNGVHQIILESHSSWLKPPKGCLKHPYISPAGPYGNDLWDWDSYWTLYGLLEINEAEVKEQIAPFAKGAFFNILEHQGKDGSLPIMICPENGDAFGSTESPDQNMAKPFIAQLAALLLKHGVMSEQEFISSDAIYSIKAYHDCFDRRYLHRDTGLYYWATDLGLGVDDDPTAWGRPVKSCASVFLNSFLYKDMLAAAELSLMAGRPDYRAEYLERTAKLAASIQKYCWDNRESAFFSVDIQCRQNLYPHRIWKTLNNKLYPFWHCLQLKVLSWSTILPLWVGIATQEQADKLIAEHFTEERLMSNYGLRALSKDEPMYAPEVIRGNPSNWLGPIWILVNYIAYETLHKYGHEAQAELLAEKILKMLEDDLEKNGSLHEYYSPETGEPVASPNFMSWNTLAGLF